MGARDDDQMGQNAFRENPGELHCSFLPCNVLDQKNFVNFEECFTSFPLKEQTKDSGPSNYVNVLFPKENFSKLVFTQQFLQFFLYLLYLIFN